MVFLSSYYCGARLTICNAAVEVASNSSVYELLIVAFNVVLFASFVRTYCLSREKVDVTISHIWRYMGKNKHLVLSDKVLKLKKSNVAFASPSFNHRRQHS